MKTLELLAFARSWPIFTVQDCAKWFPNTKRTAILLALTRGVASGLIIRLRRGLYLVNQKPYPDPFAIASRLDPLAVVSIETVLHRFGMIPEIPFATTLITPAGTARYQAVSGGSFHFRHIKKELLFGYELENHSPYSVRVATPEKALLDFLWFHRFERDQAAYLSELRLDIPKEFSWKTFRSFAQLFAHKHMSEFAKTVIKNYS